MTLFLANWVIRLFEKLDLYERLKCTTEKDDIRYIVDDVAIHVYRGFL